MMRILSFLISSTAVFALVPPSATTSIARRQVALRGGAITEINAISGACSWMTGIRTPATLVAGSALSSFLAFSHELKMDPTDTFVTKTLKRFCLVLLFSSFFLEVFCIFASTVTSTWLMAFGSENTPTLQGINPMATSAISFLERELEFEFVTMRLFFIQGLLGWLTGVAVRFLLPCLKSETARADRELAKFYSRGLVTLVLMMLHYFQRHIVFYPTYAHMVARFFVLGAKRFWPPSNPLIICAAAASAWTISALVTAVKEDFVEKTKLI